MVKKAPKNVEAPAAEAPVIESTAPAVEAPKEPKLVHNKKLAIVGEHTDESKITWNVTKNPRAPGRGTFDRFAAYFGAATVGEYRAKGGTLGDLNWDLRAGFLSIEGVTLSDDPADRAPRKPPVNKGKKKAAEPTVSVETPVEAEVVTETVD